MTRHEYLKAKEEAIYYFGLCIDALVLPMVDEYENEYRDEYREEHIDEYEDGYEEDHIEDEWYEVSSLANAASGQGNDSEYDGYERRDGYNEYDNEIAKILSDYRKLRHRKHWTADEQIALIRMAANGMSVDEMSKRLMRTEKGIVKQLWKYGYGIRDGRAYNRPMNDE